MTDSASGTKAPSNEPATLADIDQLHERLDNVWTGICITARVQAEGSADDERRLAKVESEATDARWRIAWLWVAASLFFVYEIVKLVIFFA